ncbi:MAG: DUF1326 domain-containing protein [Gemmatimonadetes bacterium]|nr:DUF1326 domain-containing protein [Gemmatimonadota bacterium]
MAVQWMIRGTEFANCNCNYGCPCQFGSPTTHGNCEGVISGHIEEGNFGDVRLDGLAFAMLFWWPGEIAAGDGRLQFVIDESASDEQRDGLGQILRGENTARRCDALLRIQQHGVRGARYRLRAHRPRDRYRGQNRTAERSWGGRVHRLANHQSTQWRAVALAHQPPERIRVHGRGNGLWLVQDHCRDRAGADR